AGAGTSGPTGTPAAGTAPTRTAPTGTAPTGTAPTGTAPTGIASAGAATPAGRVWAAARTATALRARLGRAGSCPPELAEATAALQDLAVRLAAPGEAVARRDELWELQSGLPAAVQAERDGPYLVTN